MASRSNLVRPPHQEEPCSLPTPRMLITAARGRLMGVGAAGGGAEIPTTAIMSEEESSAGQPAAAASFAQTSKPTYLWNGNAHL